MAMEAVLKQLEARIEELVEAYREAVARSAEFEAKAGGLEAELNEARTKVSGEFEANEKVASLEKQRDELAARLEKVLGLIDGVLARDSSSGSDS